MTMIRGLVGLSFLCTAAGFSGPIPTRARSAGSSSSSGGSTGSSGSSHGTSYTPSATQQAPQLMRGWRSINPRGQRVRTCMTADEGDTPETTAAAAAPRLKRVRRRRKDGASVAVTEEEEREVPAVLAGEQTTPPAAPPAVAAAQAVIAPPAPSQQVQQQAMEEDEEDEEDEAPFSVGGTKGTKVRVVDSSDDDMSEKFAEVASAASGAAGGAATAVSGAAKSAIGAAMSALGQGPPTLDTFDKDGAPAPGQRRAGKRTTPGKTAAELADLGADIERFRRAENRQPETAGESIASGAKNVISTIISVDFFVVIAFMLWFIAGVVSSYGFGETFLLDQFNDKWTPVVQPALGVLMGGTIAGGVVSKLGESGDDEDGNNRQAGGGGPRGI
ncbi:unnamed protein product [Scytosiphon promiscuus]